MPVAFTPMELVVHESVQAVADAAAKRVATSIEDTGARFSLGLAGGSTPEETYRALAELSVDWSGVHAWLSDERWVPHDHERSNGRMAANALMNHVDAQFHRPSWSDLLDPRDSAAEYEATLRRIHRGSGPDLVLLGMGDDGHTASLFPNTDALDEQERWFVANDVPQQKEERLTATFPFLWHAERILVLVVGTGKSKALKESFEGATPAGRLGSGDAKVEWFVDAEAASLLS